MWGRVGATNNQEGMSWGRRWGLFLYVYNAGVSLARGSGVLRHGWLGGWPACPPNGLEREREVHCSRP